MKIRGVFYYWMIVVIFLGITAVLAFHNQPPPVAKANVQGLYSQYLPVIKNGDPLNCRFGVNVIEAFHNLQINSLPLGWYVNYLANANPVRPQGASYAPIIRLTQTGPDATDYSYHPSGANLLNSIAGNPGADWYIGNEPDRRDFQDDIEPHVYAAVYHELYNLIKTADPTARVFAGTIVQPTPIRLQYLDMILDSYQQQNGGDTLPADGWSIHNFILNEVSCDYDPGNCWGAEIPPGMDDPYGEIVAIDDNDNMEMFEERIIAFRQWMYDRGYRDLPLKVSEYGILMPDWLGFPPARVNTFMDASLAFMLQATDPVLGSPHDNNRLVQAWSWYSTGAPTDPFNGHLFTGSSFPWALSSMGQNYADAISQQSSEVDYYPTEIVSEQATISSSVTITLQATIANSGNTVPQTVPVVVRFYNGHPDDGGVQIGADEAIALAGCGRYQAVTTTWSDVLPGSYELFVEVDAERRLAETDEGNNLFSILITVP